MGNSYSHFSHLEYYGGYCVPGEHYLGNKSETPGLKTRWEKNLYLVWVGKKNKTKHITKEPLKHHVPNEYLWLA